MFSNNKIKPFGCFFLIELIQSKAVPNMSMKQIFSISAPIGAEVVEMPKKELLPVGLEPTASELEVRRAAIAPRELDERLKPKKISYYQGSKMEPKTKQTPL